MITLDASLIIAHLERQDTHHAAATAYLREHAGERFLMHPLNLAEVLVGGARTGREQEMLDDLSAIGIEAAARPDNKSDAASESLRLARIRAEARLKLPDCCALDTALTSGSSALATFDINLATAARARGITVAPDERWG